MSGVVTDIANTFDDYYKKSGALEYNKYDVMVQKIDTLMDTGSALDRSAYQPLMEVSVAASAGDIEVMLSKEETTSHFPEGGTPAKYVFLKKTSGLTKLTAEMSSNRKKTYLRKNITPDDKIHLDSLVFLTEPAVNYSRAFLHQTPIAKRMQLSQTPIYLSRVFRPKTEIVERSIRDLSKEYGYAFEKGETAEFEEQFLDMIKRMELSPEIDGPRGELFSQFMNTIIPNTKNLVKWIKPYSSDVYSYSELLKRLEPFLVYDADVCYRQYMEMWYFVKENAKKLRATLLEKSREYGLFKSVAVGAPSHAENRVSSVLQKNKDIMDLFKACYYLHQNIEGVTEQQKEYEAVTKFKDQYPFSSELLKILYETDNATTYFSLLSFLEYNLYTPENVMETLDQAKITETSGKQTAACGKLFIAKKYTSSREFTERQRGG